ncbi:hypothetical protein [Caballeronia glathei]|jgi:hypothetical protein|uniref:hypothetical protein n=1 Tax=Caballeronia glathei TaxID=60547 RepID=UPI001E36D7EF|nr:MULTISPECIES: hypothetical protein [Burkholderiaceae]
MADDVFGCRVLMFRAALSSACARLPHDDELPRPAGYRLIKDADALWCAFETAHHKANLPDQLEIPMEPFARAVEIVLKDSELRDDRGYTPEVVLWDHAVRHSAYVQSRHAMGRVLAAAA